MSQSKTPKTASNVVIAGEGVRIGLSKLADRMTELGLKEYTRYLSSPGRVFFLNLLAGVARGLGFFLGATVVVAVVTIILTKILGSIPWLSDFVQWFQQSIDPSNLKVIQNFDFLRDAQGNIVEIVPKINK